MARYSVIYTFDEVIKTQMEEIANAVEDRFGIPSRFHDAPPHITIKYPFEIETHEEVLSLKNQLGEFCKNHSPVEMTLSGIGLFSDAGVFFAEIALSRKASLLQMDLLHQFLGWIDLLGYSPWRGAQSFFQSFDFGGVWHGTLCRASVDKKTQERSEYEKVRAFFEEITMLERRDVLMDRMTLITFDQARHVPVQTFLLGN